MDFTPVQTRRGVFNAATGTRVAMTGGNRTRSNPCGFVPHPDTGHPVRVMGFWKAIDKGFVKLVGGSFPDPRDPRVLVDPRQVFPGGQTVTFPKAN